MAKPDTIFVDGHAFSWRRLCELRRQQMEAWTKAEARQPPLFELRTDSRPRSERTVAARYRELSLLDVIRGESLSNDENVSRQGDKFDDPNVWNGIVRVCEREGSDPSLKAAPRVRSSLRSDYGLGDGVYLV